MEILSTQVILYVKDMASSLAFYRNALGLTLTYDGGDDWRTLDAGGTSLALHSGGNGAKNSDRSGISFLVEDVSQARQECNDQNAGFGEILNPHPGVSFCETEDPDGNPVFLKLR